jgi:sensor histidine kinase regulating citrate/malate metabolism
MAYSETNGQPRNGQHLRNMGLALLGDGVVARAGSMSIESSPGDGTRVKVTLPSDRG